MNFKTSMIDTGKRQETELLEFGAIGDTQVPTAVVLHGLPGSAYDAYLATLLANEIAEEGGPPIRIIAPNRPGYGNSTYDRRRRLEDWPETLERILDAMRVETATVLGCSTGGVYAQVSTGLENRIDLAAIISGISLMNSPALLKGMRFPHRQFAMIGNRFPSLTGPLLKCMQVAMNTRKLFLKDEAKTMSNLPQRDREILTLPHMQHIRKVSWKAVSIAGMTHDINLLTHPESEIKLGQNVPQCIYHGDADTFAVPQMFHANVALAGNNVLEKDLIPDEGHFMIADPPDSFRASLKKILSGEMKRTVSGHS